MNLRSVGPRLCLLLGVLLGLAAPARATWSVILVNRVTGEIVVAGATCLANLDLELYLPVIRVGTGAACAQSLIDSGAVNRKKIWSGFQNGLTPAQILAQLAAGDFQHKARQYGIVDRLNAPIGFTGNSAGQGKLDLVGSFGDYAYAVQGNVLTSPLVVQQLELVLKQQVGDAGQKVLAAMQAAYALGGDGRCSCSQAAPTSCGAPPPSFTKSAHVGFFIIARVGDIDGVCTGPLGCATGQYFLDLNVIGQVADPDPVLTLASQYAAWRATRLGQPDHLTSTLSADVQRLVADGQSEAQIEIQLKDIDGQNVPTGGASISVQSASAAPLLGQVGPVVDLGAGRYRFAYQAGTAAGQDSLRIVVSQSGQTITLQPDLTLPIDPLAPLHCGFDLVSANLGATVPLTLNLDPAEPYLVLGSAAGTSPGITLPFGVLPLNSDSILLACLTNPNQGPLQNTLGVTSANGWSQARLVVAATALSPLLGLTLDWSAVRLGSLLGTTPAVGFVVAP
jgi:Family of unknown function (DUF1028)/Invasin, domain 3